jgi:hypothetical protein
MADDFDRVGSDWPDDYDRVADAYDALTLAHYIRSGHRYVLAMRSGLAVPRLGAGQYVFYARIDDCNQCWRIHKQVTQQGSGHD